MVAQAPRGADDDVRATFQRPAFGADVHPADATGQHRARRAVEPFEFAADLQGKLAGRRNDQRAGGVGGRHLVALHQQVTGHRQAKGHGLARARLCRDQQVLSGQGRVEHGLLHRRQGVIALFGERGRQRSGQRGQGGGHGNVRHIKRSRPNTPGRRRCIGENSKTGTARPSQYRGEGGLRGQSTIENDERGSFRRVPARRFAVMWWAWGAARLGKLGPGLYPLGRGAKCAHRGEWRGGRALGAGWNVALWGWWDTPIAGHDAVPADAAICDFSNMIPWK